VPDTASAAILATAFAGAVMDAATRRIPNALTATAATLGFLAGVAQAAFAGVRLGVPALAETAACVAVTFAACFLLWRGGRLGGGDAKLLVAVSAWAGAAATIEIACASCVAGLALALLRARRREAAGLAPAAPTQGASAAARASPETHGRAIPFGVAVFLGACAWWIVGRFE
jgi:prepilin peptidase CpaA